MKHLILLSLITLSVVLACHSSCNCDQGSNVCKSCKFANIGAKVDTHNRSCPCPAGWYSEVTSSTFSTPTPPKDCVYTEVIGAFYASQCIGACDLLPSLEVAKAQCQQDPTCKSILHYTLENVDGYLLFKSDTPVVDHPIKLDIWIQSNCQPQPPTTVTTFDFECKRLLNTDGSGKDISEEMAPCKLEIGLKTKLMKVLTDCHFENIDGKSYVVSDIRLDVTDGNFNDACLGYIRTKLQYKSPSNNQYIDLPAKYITENPSGNKTIKIPLIDIFDMATSQTVNDQQIIQVVNLKIFIGHEDSFVRSHKWDLIVYTNRDQVEVFQIDVDVQETEGCQPGQECIVIADLDTVSDVYTDATFAHVHSPPHQYNVGDIFYAKIKFADPTYTKRLTFIKLYFKSDSNKIFNFSSITSDSWDGTGLRISLPLVQPSQGAVIQVNMKISTVNARLLSSTEEEQQVQSKFTVSISDGQGELIGANSLKDSSNASNASILLGMSILSTLFLLF